MRACALACMAACLRARTRAHVPAYVRLRTRAYVCACVRACPRACLVHVCVRPCMQPWIRAQLCLRARLVCSSMHACAHTFIFARVRMCVRACNLLLHAFDMFSLDRLLISKRCPGLGQVNSCFWPLYFFLFSFRINFFLLSVVAFRACLHA